jgi:hypothetical protein
MVPWGLGLIGVAALGVLVWDLDALPAALLAGAGLAAIVASLIAVIPWRRLVAPRRDSSGASLAIAFGLTLVVVGFALGSAFLWPGVGVVVLGTIGLLGERAR